MRRKIVNGLMSVRTLIVLSVAFVNCGGQGASLQNNGDVKEVVLSSISDKPLSDYIEKYEYITLKTDSVNFLGNVYDCTIVDDKILASNRRRNSLFIFDMEGNLINVINNQGRGPREYISISSYAFDHKSKKIVLSDRDSQKILIYSSQGNLEEIIKVKTNFISGIFPVGDKFVTLNDGSEKQLPKYAEKYNLTIIDREGNVENSFLPDRTPKPLFYIQNAICMKDGSVLYTPILSDTVYSVTESGAKPIYHFNYENTGLRKFSDSELKDVSLLSMMESGSTLYSYEIDKYACNMGGGNLIDGDDLMFLFLGKNKRYLIFYDKNTDRSLVIPSLIDLGLSFKIVDVDDNFVLNVMINSTPFHIEGNKVYSVFSSQNAMMGDEKFADNHILKEACVKIKASENDGILVYTLKPF